MLSPLTELCMFKCQNLPFYAAWNCTIWFCFALYCEFSVHNRTETLTYDRRTGQALPTNMRDLHYYAFAIISYQNIAGLRCKVSNIVWVVYEYPRRRDDCGEDGCEGDREGWSEEAFINPLSPTRVYIRADVHTYSPLHILAMFFFSHPLYVYTCLRTCICTCMCVRVCGPSFDLMFERPRSTQPGLITQTWRPLWLVLAYQILLLHMWYRISSWRQRLRMYDGENGLGVG